VHPRLLLARTVL
jgi:hypothetical protein